MNQLKSLLSRLTLHHRGNFLFYFNQLIKALKIESLDDLSKDLVAFFLGDPFIEEYLDSAHESHVIVFLQLYLLH